MAGHLREVRALVAGLAVGVLGIAYILLTRSNPLHGLLYHVPLAVAFGAFAWSVAFEVPHAARRVRVVATLPAAVLVLGRAIGDWPLSGHGVLGALMVVLAPRPWQKLLAGAILVQSWVTKSVNDTAPLAVVSGALAGGALGLLSLALERRAARDPSSGLE